MLAVLSVVPEVGKDVILAHCNEVHPLNAKLKLLQPLRDGSVMFFNDLQFSKIAAIDDTEFNVGGSTTFFKFIHPLNTLLKLPIMLDIFDGNVHSLKFMHPWNVAVIPVILGIEVGITTLYKFIQFKNKYERFAVYETDAGNLKYSKYENDAFEPKPPLEL